MKYGVMGGTFDPVHIGHLIIAIDSIITLGLSEFYFIPALIPPHKQHKVITPFEQRLEMLKLAIVNDSRLKVLDLEFNRGGVSYTVDTLRELKNLWGGDSEIFFLLGADSFLELPTWKEPKEVSILSKLVIIPRVGFSLECPEAEEVYKIINKKSVVKLNNRIIEISSAEIRKRVSLGYPISYLVPTKVEEYIFSHKLYQKGG